MKLTRRDTIKAEALTSAAAASGGLPGPIDAAPRGLFAVWHNWSGGQSCTPTGRFTVASEDELAALVRSAQGAIRPVGSGHSFSALVPTDGSLVSLANMSGLISHDEASLQAEFWAGTPMSRMGDALMKIGQALPNMADIDYQSLGGAISTSTHGSGARYGSYSSTVVGLRLVIANGEVLDCDAHKHPDIFNAARVSLGGLGVITRVRLQNRKAFRLRSKNWIQNTEELLEDMPRLMRENDHIEIYSILHSDVSVASALNETEDKRTIPKDGCGDIKKVDLLQCIHSRFRDSPHVEAALLNFVARHLVSFPEAIDDSYKMFANVRDVRFNEMEYEIPAEAGPACAREILKKVLHLLESAEPAAGRKRQRSTARLRGYRRRPTGQGYRFRISLARDRATAAEPGHRLHRLDLQGWCRYRRRQPRRSAYRRAPVDGCRRFRVPVAGRRER
jgi:FAD/FMN-containing dehydrogenase